jgi:hypothetical protein
LFFIEKAAELSLGVVTSKSLAVGTEVCVIVVSEVHTSVELMVVDSKEVIGLKSVIVSDVEFFLHCCDG